MIGGVVQVLAVAAQSHLGRVVSYSIAAAVVLGLLVTAGWVFVVDRDRGGGVGPTETDPDELS